MGPGAGWVGTDNSVPSQGTNLLVLGWVDGLYRDLSYSLSVCWIFVEDRLPMCVPVASLKLRHFFASHPKDWEQWRLNCDPGMKIIFNRQPED